MQNETSYWKGKKVLVTGGAGFIGSYLVEFLVVRGASVAVADDLSHGALSNLFSVRDRIQFHQVDLRYLDKCESICTGQDVVMNLASPVSGVGYSTSHHGEMLTGSVLIGFNMLEAARRKGVKRFLVVSSSCVYPDDAVLPTPESESSRGAPETVNLGYGWGKRMLELQAAFYAKEYGMEIAIARPFNAYGPRQSLQVDRLQVMPAIICKVLKGDDPVVVWGTGNQTRSFVHGRDFALGLLLITELYAVADPVNVGHNRETTLRDLAERIIALSGRTVRLIFDATKPEGAARKSANVEKLRRATNGFYPAITVDEGLREMIDSIRAAGLAEPGTRP